jgi:hypothetical protein
MGGRQSWVIGSHGWSAIMGAAIMGDRQSSVGAAAIGCSVDAIVLQRRSGVKQIGSDLQQPA